MMACIQEGYKNGLWLLLKANDLKLLHENLKILKFSHTIYFYKSVLK